MSFHNGLNVFTDYRANGLPALVTPEGFDADTSHSSAVAERVCWRQCRENICQAVEALLHRHGGILFRGFAERGEDSACKEFAGLFSDNLLSYEFGSTPRTDLGEGIYTATEYPAHQIIPLHNEQAYTLHWPLHIWFHCVQAPLTGGETSIADSRRIYKKIPDDIRQRFEEKRLLYVRNYGNGLDLPWSKVFNTDSKAQVEAYCRQHRIDFEWKEDGELRTRQRCQATARHPVTGDWVWFNQAHLFHVSNLEPSAREVLLEVVATEDLPRNVYYGDGSPIEESVLEQIRSVLAEEIVLFPWQEGDFMMLDNMLAAHGRSSFTGARKIVVAMANGYTETSE